jgi:hypothetical protein
LVLDYLTIIIKTAVVDQLQTAFNNIQNNVLPIGQHHRPVMQIGAMIGSFLFFLLPD